MFMCDPQHSGYSPSRMPSCVEKKWEYSVDPNPYMYRSAKLVISEGKLIAAPGPFRVLDVNDGSLLLQAGGSSYLSFPAATQRKVYFGMEEGVVCLNADTGEVIWKHEEKYIWFFSSPIVIEGRVVIGSESGFFDYWGDNAEAITREIEHKRRRVLCLDAGTGEILWEFYADGVIDASPAYFDGVIYVNDGDGNIYCLNLETGELLSKYRMRGYSDSSLSLDEERIYIGTGNGILNCLSRETGEILWTYDCGGEIHAVPALGYGKVFFGDENGTFYCLNAEDGTLVWEIETGSTLFSAVVVADSKVAFGTADGRLYIADAQTGRVTDLHVLEGIRITSLALSEGKLFVGEINGRITCFEEAPCTFETSSSSGGSPLWIGKVPFSALISILVVDAVFIGFLVLRLFRNRKKPNP